MFGSSFARCGALAVVAALGWSTAANAAVITLVGENNTISAAVSAGREPLIQTKTLSGVPSVTVASVENVANANYAAITANLSHSAFSFIFAQGSEIGFNQNTGHLQFKSDVDVTYTLAGSYTTVGEDHVKHLKATLNRADAAVGSLFGNEQVIVVHSGVTNTLNLGGTEGFASLGGSLTGTLVGGVTYDLDFIAQMESVSDPVGNGSVTLSFANVAAPPGGPGAVPLPLAAWAGLALGGMIVAGVKGKRRA